MAGLAATALLTTNCQQRMANTTDKAADTDTLSTTADTALVASLRANAVYALGDSVSILFTVTNPTTDTLRFTQYHTPFEGFMSNFLTITDTAGTEVAYIGAMTRRIMPPPADTYHTLAPGQQDSVRFHLSKGYRFEKTGTYTLQYNSGAISGVDNGAPIQVEIK